MNALVNATPDQTMTSLEIAELTGKRHDNVKRTIEILSQETDKRPAVIQLPHSEEVKNHLGQSVTQYVFSGEQGKLDSITITAQLCPEFTAAIVKRWQELEAAQFKAPAQLTTLEILQMAMQAEQGRLQAITERDHAIATKAQIGSKREATAMANTATANRKLKAIEAELGRCIDHATILAVQNATGCEYSWRPLKAYCKAKGIDPVKVHCPRFKFVQSWPAEAWLEVHGVDIVALFGEVTA